MRQSLEEPMPPVVQSPSPESLEDHARNKLADPNLTSQISIQKFCCMVSQFSNYKRGLVTETGFGGLMHLKITHKLNLKFSLSLMVRVDPEECILALDQSRKIPITDQEINDAFGLPQGGRIIPPGHSDLSEVCIEYSRLASSISTKGVHSLKAAEFIVSKTLDDKSSKVERECFKIAFVIFSVGHVLNLCAKHDYTSVDYWAALGVASEINSFNWCSFVKDSLMKGVRKIKSDIINGNNTIHIVGCHLLLQVIALDKIETSSRHIAQGILPRVKVFDHESVKKAIDSITSHEGHDLLFAGPECLLKASVQPHNYVPIRHEHTSNGTPNKYDPSTSTASPRVPIIKKSKNMIGPVEFVNIMRRKFPDMADDSLGILLKEHNTRLMANISEIRHTTQLDMLKFLDELAACLSRKCICCQLSGLSNCRLKDNHYSGSIMIMEGREDINMANADCSDSEGSSSVFNN